jgi:hypothetical protein
MVDEDELYNRVFGNKNKEIKNMSMKELRKQLNEMAYETTELLKRIMNDIKRLDNVEK